MAFWCQADSTAVFTQQKLYYKNVNVVREPHQKNPKQPNEVGNSEVGMKTPVPSMATLRWCKPLCLAAGVFNPWLLGWQRCWGPPDLCGGQVPLLPAPAPCPHLQASRTDFLEQQPREVMMHLVARWTPIKREGKYGMSSNLLLKIACLSCLYLRQ